MARAETTIYEMDHYREVPGYFNLAWGCRGTEAGLKSPGRNPGQEKHSPLRELK